MTTEVFPHQLDPLEDEVEEEVKRKFLAYRGGLVKVQPTGYLMLKHYSMYAQKYYNFKFREDDVIIMTYPKCGTTWMQEIVWTMRNGVDTSTTLDLGARSPFLEFDSIECPDLEPFGPWVEAFKSRNPDKDPKREGLFLEMVASTPSPRTIKTHLPFSLLNPAIIGDAKVVYVARNPKDTCVSFYHHHRLIKCHDFVGDFQEFLEFWCKDLVMYSPYWSHVAEGWAKRDYPNVLFTFYEDMQEDITRELGRLNAFLGTGLTDGQLQRVAEHAKFSNMKSRPTTNPTKMAVHMGRFKENEGDIIRKGVTGDWVNYFTRDMEDKFQAWMKSSKEQSEAIPIRYQI